MIGRSRRVSLSLSRPSRPRRTTFLSCCSDNMRSRRLTPTSLCAWYVYLTPFEVTQLAANLTRSSNLLCHQFLGMLGLSVIYDFIWLLRNDFNKLIGVLVIINMFIKVTRFSAPTWLQVGTSRLRRIPQL